MQTALALRQYRYLAVSLMDEMKPSPYGTGFDSPSDEFRSSETFTSLWAVSKFSSLFLGGLLHFFLSSCFPGLMNILDVF